MNIPKEIPKILLPIIPVDPKLNDPAWMLPTPRIHIFKHGGAVNLDTVEFRDKLGRYHVTPPGMPCDGMSYPWIARHLFGWQPYDKETLRSGWTHNKSYALNDYFTDWKRYVTWSQADENLEDGLDLEVPTRLNWRANTCYIAVHYMGGRLVWDHKNREKHMIAWLNLLAEDNTLYLDSWIQGLIAADKAT
jgi:hypothetical protein